MSQNLFPPASTTGGLTDAELRATPVPVSGTLTAVTTVGTITNVVHVDDNSGSLTIDAVSLPLPTGAATAAKQPALGTAGTASADVITVQGVASMTALKVDGSAVTQPVSIAGTVTTTGGLTDTQLRASAVPVSLASVPSHAVTNAGTFATQATLQANSGVDIGKLTANQSVNVSQINGVTPLMGSGVMGTGSPRVTIASDNDALTVKQATGTNLHAVIDSGTVTTVSTVTNLSQLGGAAIAMGAGVRSAGTQRVTIATDDTVNVAHVSGTLGQGSKNVTTAGTAVAIAATQAATWVIVQAKSANTGTIAVGGSGVLAASAGILLSAGQSVTLLIADVANVFIDSTVNGEGVRFTYGS
jgi:hypothetical protein